MDIEWKRWNGDYTLRQDEVIEMANLLDALSLALKKGILVLGPTFNREAEFLKHIDWLPWDEEPIDQTGAVCAEIASLR